MNYDCSGPSYMVHRFHISRVFMIFGFNINFGLVFIYICVGGL